MQFGKQNQFKKALYSKGTIFVLLVLIILLGRSVWKRLQIERDIAGHALQTQAELSELSQRKEDLQKRVKYLEGDRGIEEEIRKNFDVAKEGEQVIILTGEGEQEAEATKEVPEAARWYQFWR